MAPSRGLITRLASWRDSQCEYFSLLVDDDSALSEQVNRDDAWTAYRDYRKNAWATEGYIDVARPERLDCDGHSWFVMAWLSSKGDETLALMERGFVVLRDGTASGDLTISYWTEQMRSPILAKDTHMRLGEMKDDSDPAIREVFRRFVLYRLASTTNKDGSLILDGENPLAALAA